MATVWLTARMLRPPGGSAGRTLAVSIAVDAVGRGLFLAGSVVFFTRQIGLSAAQVGTGLAVGGVVGLVATFPVGLAADRFGARRVLIALHVYRALALAAYTVIHGFTGFVVVTGLVAVAAGSTVPVLQALVGDAVSAAQRVTTMGYLRSVQNAGFAAGGVLAAGVITLDTRAAYVGLILINAASFAVSAALVARIEASAPASQASQAPTAPPAGARVLYALRDRPFLAISVGNGVLLLHTSLLAVGLPLWILLHTSVPRVMVAVVFVLNTVLAVGLQVPVSATANTLTGGAGAYRRAGVALVATCLLLAASGRYDTGPVAIALLIMAVVALTFGETLQSAAAWSAGYGLAPERLRGSYLAVLGLGNNAQNVVGPMVVTAAVAVGARGLVWLAVAILLASALTSAVVQNRGGTP